MTPSYSNRVVAFIDILGFGALVKRLSSDTTLQKKLHRALAQIKTYKCLSRQKDTALSNLEVSVFSDSIAISSGVHGLSRVIWAAIGLQSKLLGLGVLVRGGISSGPTFHADDMLYGEGMLNAYYLESRTAVYPRIIIDPKLITEAEAGLCAMLLARDADGLWFIDPFSFGGLPDGSEALLEDGHDPHAVYLEELGKRIDQELAPMP